MAVGFIGILGVLVGVFAERLVQRYGKVRCEMEPMGLTYGRGNKAIDERSLPVILEKLPEPKWGGVSLKLRVEVKLFNEKDVKIGLRDIKVVFEDKNGSELVECPMLDIATWDTSKSKVMDELKVVNLPSREWIGHELSCSITNDQAHTLVNAEEAYFQGYFPDGRLFRKRIPQDSDNKFGRGD